MGSVVVSDARRMERRLLSVLLAASVAVAATPGRTQPSDTAGPTVEGQEVEGTVQRVDPRARTITLDDGQEYWLSPTVLPNPGVLGEGSILSLRFDTDGGRNSVTHLQIRLWRPARER